MSEELQMWMEIAFNVAYLIAVWVLVYLMAKRQPNLPDDLQAKTKPFIWAFALLALGDTGHVGFRVVGYALGDLSKTFTLFGQELGLAGMGTLSTSITVTLFYALMVVIWQRRFEKPYSWFGYLLFLAAAARLVIMTMPGNQWNSLYSPYPFSLYRNLPLVLQGLGVTYLLLRDALKERDNTYAWIGGCILISFGFYIPVIFLVQKYPLIGMFMIPKTMAYVAIAVIAYKKVFK